MLTALPPHSFLHAHTQYSYLHLQESSPIFLSSRYEAMEKIKQTFEKCKQEKRSALVAYVTAGYPRVAETTDILLGMQTGGAGEELHSQLQLFCYKIAFFVRLLIHELNGSWVD
jgi:hypothetical protein